MPSRYALLWLLLCASGCGTFVTTTLINDGYGAGEPRQPRSIAIFSSGPPATPHVDVALLEAEQTHGLNDQGTDVMLERLREQAGKLGCDGIVLGSFSSRGSDLAGTGWEPFDPGSTTLHATCIVYRERTRARPAPPRGPVDPIAEHQLADFEEPR